MTTNETNKTPTLIKSEIDSNVTLLTYRTNGVQHIFIDDKPILVGDKNSEGFKLKEKFFGGNKSNGFVQDGVFVWSNESA